MHRITTLFALALAGLIGAAATLIYVLVTGWSADVGANAELHGGEPPAETDARPLPRIVLVTSTATARYFATLPGASPTAYEAKLVGWEDRLARGGYAVERRDVARLDVPDALPGDALLVVPSAAALADAEVEALLAAVRAGRGMLATWQLGLHRADGSWRGYGPLGELVEASPLEGPDVPAGSTLRFAAVLGEGALAAGLPAGARLEIQPFDAPLVVQSPAAVADWVRWEILPFGEPGRPIHPTAAAARRVGRGRVVWLNFDPRALVASGDDDEVTWLETLVENGLRWAANRPLAAVERWPAGARMASVLGLDTEMQFAAGRDLAAAARAAGVPLTAFMVAKLAEADPDTVRALAAAGEVGSHTVDHRPLAGQSLASQEAQLKDSRAILAQLSGQRVDGFRPPEEQVDADTWLALRAAGYDYVAGVPNKDRAEPTLLGAGGTGLVVLPRIPHDDYEWTVRTPLGDAARTASAVLRDRAYVRRLGGLWFFDVHTQYLGDPGIAAGLAAVLAIPPDATHWRATGHDVATWWRKRAGVTVRVDERADGRIALTVRSREEIARIAVEVHLPDGWDAVRVSAVEGPMPAIVAGTPVRIELGDLGAGERRRMTLAAEGDGS